MKKAFVIVAALLVGPQAYAQSDPSRAAIYYPSCLAAADIVQGKRPAADSPEASKQLTRAALCFGAITAIMNLAPLFKPEFAVCPPDDAKPSPAQMIPVVVDLLKKHPEQMNSNFHQVAVSALVAAWPCSK